MSLSPQDQDLLDNVDWHIVPVLNPDGYVYTFTEDRLWRKSRSLHNGGNCPGVDLNRSMERIDIDIVNMYKDSIA